MTRRTRARLQVAAAERRLALASHAWHRSIGRVHRRLERTSVPLIVGSGLVTGAIASLLPLRALVRGGFAVADLAFLVARLPLKALLRVAQRTTDAPHEPSQDAT